MKKGGKAAWVVAVLLGLGMTAQVSLAQKTDLSAYFPLNEDAVGNVLVYIQKENGQEERLREVAAGTLVFDGQTALLSGEMNTGCWSFEGEAMGWSDDSLVFFGEADCHEGEMEVMVFESGLDFLPRFLEEKKSMKRTPIPGLETEVELQGRVDVSVPAGTFEDSIKLKVTFQEEDESEECQSWYAESIGMVKSMCTETFEGQTVNSSEELVAALIDGELVGNPLKEGEVVSFDLATAETSGCGMLIRNIALKGEDGPELWWAGFVFNEEGLKWELTSAGTSGAQVPDQSCSIVGLGFTDLQMTIRRDDTSGKPILNMVLPLQGSDYALGFSWNVNTLSWDYIFHFELQE